MTHEPIHDVEAPETAKRQPAIDVRCSTCGHAWHQYGNRTGHCSGCHQTFEGSALFDWHQRLTDDGEVICARPGDERWDDTLTDTGQSWRKPFISPWTKGEPHVAV